MSLFEGRDEPLLGRWRFVTRMLLFLAVGVVADALIVWAGAWGFHGLNALDWRAAWVDAALVVTGNGPRHPAHTPSAKDFLGLYALAGGVAHLMVVALVLTPAAHRLLHAFHLRAPDDS